MLRERQKIGHRKNRNSRNKSCFSRIFRWKIELLESRLLRKQRDWKHAMHAPRFPTQRKLTKKEFFRRIDIYLTRGNEKCDGEREIIDGGIFRYISRCEIRCHSAGVVWWFESGILQCRTHAITRLLHRGIRETDEGEGVQSLGKNIYLNLHGKSIQSKCYR